MPFYDLNSIVSAKNISNDDTNNDITSHDSYCESHIDNDVIHHDCFPKYHRSYDLNGDFMSGSPISSISSVSPVSTRDGSIQSYVCSGHDEPDLPERDYDLDGDDLSINIDYLPKSESILPEQNHCIDSLIVCDELTNINGVLTTETMLGKSKKHISKKIIFTY